jgi:hypothetical protein
MRIKPTRNVIIQLSLAALCASIIVIVNMKAAAMLQQDTDANREITRLLRIVQDERLRTEDPDKVAQAIAELGEMRATIAVDDLIKLITFRRTFPQERGNPEGVINEIHMITPAGRFPAIGSLFEIGKPSLPGLIRLIADHEPKSLESENALIAVRLIFRDEPLAGVQYLRDAATRTNSSLRKERLTIAANAASRPPL